MAGIQRNVSVTGLGYVGLAVAAAFGQKGKVTGFDIDSGRVAELSEGHDRTGQISPSELAEADIEFTDDISRLSDADFHIIAVPTPIDEANQPDLGPLLTTSRMVGGILKRGDIVVFESTVYPGVTEELCAPVLEKASGLSCGVDFHIGYSPERINPGDPAHKFSNIVKVVSAQDEESLDIIASVYQSVVSAGVFRGESIMVTEAAKVIENTQRDLNIALMNELAVIFDRLGLDTRSVLAAAGTKWNFLDFVPGLVGGHCIGVDPYYLTHLAEKVNYIPQVILAGRRINDSMGRFVAQRAIKEMVRTGHEIVGSRVTVLGITFKDDCPDLRNSKAVDIVRELEEYDVEVQTSDPLANPGEVTAEYGIELVAQEDLLPSAMVIVAVGHREYRDMSIADLGRLMGDKPVLIDVRGIFSRDEAAAAGMTVWRL